MQSETIGKLAEALAKAQGEIKAPSKGKTAQIKSDKGSYSYSYADLADVIEALRGPLSKHGLSFVQPIRFNEGNLVLVTRLMHLSGEWLESEFPVPTYQRAQEQGSAITYARRYTLTALLGIAAEDDDDGKAAHDAKPAAQQPQSASRRQSSSDKPYCPKCGNDKTVMKSKFNPEKGEWYCNKKNEGCGNQWNSSGVPRYTSEMPPEYASGTAEDGADDPFGESMDEDSERTPF